MFESWVAGFPPKSDLGCSKKV